MRSVWALEIQMLFIQNNMGDTALIWGTRIVYPDGLRGNPANKRFQIVRSLLDAGANPNIRNNAGATAYDVALHHFNNRVAIYSDRRWKSLRRLPDSKVG